MMIPCYIYGFDHTKPIGLSFYDVDYMRNRDKFIN